ncbi:hypothetical protein GF377_03245 [candidate division GN15 bacterium]|nr:hypothetical protein [candidate division GN15 bacterium]
MFKGIRTRRTPSSTTQRDKSGKIRLALKRSVDIVLIVAAALSAVYVGSLVLELATGHSVTAATPDRIVRVQVVDAIGNRELCSEVEARLASVSDLELAIEVVDRVRFDLREVPRSFIIARDEDRSAARLLAARLGLDPEEVIHKPLTHDTRFVTASLVVGQNARDCLLADLGTEEK